MEQLSIFDIFKIGVGPSSSHTLGPWKAALDFIQLLGDKPINALKVHLYGSLSKTGKGHATDIAVMLGLSGQDPETIDTRRINDYIAVIRETKSIQCSTCSFEFDPDQDIVFEIIALPSHPNTLKFEARFEDGSYFSATYYSVGGGFILREGAEENTGKRPPLPHPIDSGADLIRWCDKEQLKISEVVMRNELALRSPQEVEEGIRLLYTTMRDSVYRGCKTTGVLPGGLNVKRRAQKMYERLFPGSRYNTPVEWLKAIRTTGTDFGNITQWVSCFALAVNEENASLGRIVTSPTNGAAGVIPAVLLYHNCFCEALGNQDIIDFILTAGEIGSIFKKRATISAAVGGCQAEIGVSAAMAAAGLTALHGGSPRHVLMAAEIAMEHHLGLTCDPVGGLVQIPCIERNTMGAMKAITASNLALTGNPDDAIVDFDTVVQTMWETARDMHNNYKETAEGGLAINLPVVLPNC